MPYAGVLLITQDNKIILQQRDNRAEIVNPKKVTTFGGSIEAGESPKRAIIRKIEEELSIKPKFITYLGKFIKYQQTHGENMGCYI